MLPLALSIAAVGLVMTQKPQNPLVVTDTWQDVDDLMLGKIREENYAVGNNWTSEQSRIIKPTIGRNDPYVSSKVWTEYHRKMNRALKDLYVKHQVADNQRIIRPSIESRQRILTLPDSTFSMAAHVPNAYVEYSTAPTGKLRVDNDFSRYDDKASNAGGINIEYIQNPGTYYGTPWGAGGQLFQNLRTKQPDNVADHPKVDKKVRFAGTTNF
jgi:hypothetical protein